MTFYLKNNSLPSFVLILISILFFTSCTTKPSTENSDSIQVNEKVDEIKKEETVSTRVDLTDLILNTESHYERTKSIGQSLKSIFEHESLEMVDSASNYKGFTQYFHNSDDEFVDIQYFNNGDVVTAVNFDIYLNKPVDVENLFNELVLVFNRKYGKPIKQPKVYSWQVPNNQQLILKDVSLKLAPGLQITFKKNGDI